MKEVYIALGSNLGNSEQIISTAISELKTLSALSIVCSSLHRTAPIDCPPGSPDFLNAVCKIFVEENVTPEELLQKLQALEKKFGRVPKTILNEPRPLDLDIISFGRETRNSPTLVIPHPRAHVRKFVLEPLAEISPELVLPGFEQSVKELLKRN